MHSCNRFKQMVIILTYLVDASDFLAFSIDEPYKHGSNNNEFDMRGKYRNTIFEL